MKPYQDKFSHLINNTLENECFTHVYLSSCLGASKKKTLVALFQCMVRHGTVQYGSLLGVFHWVQYLVPGTFLVTPRPGFQAIRTVTKTWRVNSTDH